MAPEENDAKRPDVEASDAATENPSAAGQIRFAGGQVEIQGAVIGGDVKELIQGNKIVAAQYFASGTEAIDWAQIDFARQFEVADLLFTEHMRRFAGAANRVEAIARYIPLWLQDDRSQQTLTHDDKQRKEWQTHKWRGYWEERVYYPTRLFLSGDVGSGKTTSLLYDCLRLGETGQQNQLTPVPIYLPLRRYTSWSSELLLQRMAEGSGLETRIVSSMWRENRRPIALFLDGADEIPASEMSEFTEALSALLLLDIASNHSVIISHRPDPKLDGMVTRLNWPILHLLPLDESQMQDLLDRYHIKELEPYLDDNLREFLQTPDLLAALALSWQKGDGGRIPVNLGEIYQLYIDRFLFANDEGQYDYRRIKRPVLAAIAYNMLAGERGNWLYDEALEDMILAMLSERNEHYRRRRRVMPADWDVQQLLSELNQSPVLAILPGAGGPDIITFSKAGYRDYYAAVYLAQQESKEVDNFHADKTAWLPILLILAGIAPNGSALFDRVFAAQPALAGDLWLENRPFGLEAPGIIRQALDEQL
ncbi:MAG: NACHT domain-containing protein, partial [Candidatus Promineifilaceae bacterium]|nr:NACHT domain-containing protein [Candidatus Promineifilaceae bacterium]